MLVARAEAVPAADLDLAKRYADILTGVDQDAADADLDDDDDDLEDAALPRDDDSTTDPGVLDELLDDDSPLLGELDLATLYPDPAELAAQSAAYQTAGGAELFDLWQRHQRPSRFGRLDLDVSWRSYTSEPRTAPHYHSEELWLIATWRR